MSTTQPIIEARLQDDPIDLQSLGRELPELYDCGGYVEFVGLIRNINHGQKVLRLDYEAYDPLATKELRRICEFAAERFGLRFVRAVHRRGLLELGQPAVVIQVLSRHRREAFDGCRYVIDQVKARVPIWKKEYYADGSAQWTQCHEHALEPHQILDEP